MMKRSPMSTATYSQTINMANIKNGQFVQYIALHTEILNHAQVGAFCWENVN